jgi:hypothetical protein
MAENYLRWSSRRNQGKRTVLIWDIFAAQRAKSVKALVEKLNIEVIYIPAGQTDEYQPLDRRFLGPMKQRARGLFGALYFTNFSVDPGMDEALTIMVLV